MGIKISALPIASTLTGSEEIPMVQSGETVGANLNTIAAFGGTVKSVAISVPAGFSVSGTPITLSGTLAISWNGTIPNAQIPSPNTTALGGVLSSSAPSNQFATGIAANGAVTYAQPSFSNISGVATNAQIPAPTVSALGGVEASTAPTNEFATGINTSGSVTYAQPSFTNISGTVAATQLPNPTVSALGGVEANLGVAHQWVNSISTSGVPALSQPSFADLSGSATLAQFPTIANSTILGNVSGSTAVPAALTGAQAESMLLFTQAGTGASQRTLDAKIKSDVWVSVLDFGADPTGSVDSTTVIQDAINSLPAAGGVVYFPAGTYKISSTLTIGNGNTTTWSTRWGVVLQGAGCPIGNFTSSGSLSSATTLSWAGAAGFSPMVSIQGPLSGWGVQDLELNCNSVTSAYGILVTSGMYGIVENVFITGCWNGIHTKTVDQGSLSGVPNTMHNKYRGIQIALHDQSGGTQGIFLSSSGNSSVTTNSCYEYFENVTISSDGVTNSVIGVYLQVCDSCIFKDIHCTFANGTTVLGVYLDYSVSTSFPSSCKFFGIDPNGTHGMSAGGTATIGDNTIESLIRTNGAVPQATNGVSWGIRSIDGTTQDLIGVTGNSIPVTGAIGEYIISRFGNTGGITSATVTISIASPAVITWTAHPFQNAPPIFDAAPVTFTTTGALPTGITANTTYYVVPSSITTNTFEIAANVANAIAASPVPINTTGTQSGTQTASNYCAMANATPATLTGIPLTAGDWEVSGIIVMSNLLTALNFSNGAWTANFVYSISTTDAALDSTDVRQLNAGISGANGQGSYAGAFRAPIGPTRFSLPSNTNVYIIGDAQYTANGTNKVQGAGVIRARRPR